MNPTYNHASARVAVLRSLILVVALCAFPASVLAALPILAVGPDARHTPIVKKITVNGQAGNDTFSFAAYRRNFTGGVRVAVGDVNGDGFADIITGPGPGMGAQVRVFDGVSGNLFAASSRSRAFITAVYMWRPATSMATARPTSSSVRIVVLCP